MILGDNLDTYLQIAETILRAARRPLSAKTILKEAYKANLVPHRLYGKTQQKTLQARLSVDILKHKQGGSQKSTFFRNRPGMFFLREFLQDQSIPAKFRREVFAHRRTRELVRGPVLTFKSNKIAKHFKSGSHSRSVDVLSTVNEGSHFDYLKQKEIEPSSAAVWAFAVVRRSDQVLSFRCGHYRDYRDSFSQKRTIGFSSLVSEDCRDLFDLRGFGIAQCGINSVSTDLNVPISENKDLDDQFSHKLSTFILSEDDGKPCVVAVLELTAPDWFEPVNPSLSINDLTWLRYDVCPNNLDDFDPWSKAIFEGCLISKGRDERSKKTG